MTKSSAITVLAAFLLASCAGMGAKTSAPVSPLLAASKGSALAVLPFDNASTDLNAETILRDMVAKGLGEKGWAVIPNASVDEKMTAMGISDGGQLPAFKPQEIAEKTGAKILCYGYIADFKFQNLGFIIRKNVELELRLVDGSTGEVLFEGAGKGSDTKIYTNKDEAKKAFLLNTGAKLVNNITNKPMVPESTKAVGALLKKIP